jgi:hypothetical protein
LICGILLLRGKDAEQIPGWRYDSIVSCAFLARLACPVLYVFWGRKPRV